MRALAAALVLSLTAQPASADSPLPPPPLANTALSDPAQEAAAKALMTEIRCVVCQGQSIADSNADLAADMRALIRRRVAAGESPQSIRGWLIARYGAWVSYDPPLSPVTAPLWLATVALLGLGLYLARGLFRRRL